ncbi:hypothetical protein HYH03_018469 [Edaphochlamys debaryana]|uniref:VOC domain-containing protein n=1 Tax=Edaphochlamys debaryana TaxID=47281 RepID=A0A835XK62_9CHLO|nr:hypothetical protein HYH03_018469 [Edaphochlamys debaryana]|eukprot:KAG2482585.1 hypothetical protein HYH03_018469 [Edaphochlamys debaryana]
MALARSAQQKTTGRARERRSTVSVVCKSLFGRWNQPSASQPFVKYGIRPATALLAAGTLAVTPSPKLSGGQVEVKGLHHVALLCENLERSLAFYQGVLGLDINPERPHHKLPYRGAWLWIGPEMIHLMELPNPDPLTGRPQHGGRDRHFCIGVASVEPLVGKLEAAGVQFTKSMSGRPAVFFRDPDMNCLEVVEMESWR